MMQSASLYKFSRMTAPNVTSAQQVTRRWDLGGSEVGTDSLQVLTRGFVKSPHRKIVCVEDTQLAFKVFVNKK